MSASKSATDGWRDPRCKETMPDPERPIVVACYYCGTKTTNAMTEKCLKCTEIEISLPRFLLSKAARKYVRKLLAGLRLSNEDDD